MLEGLYRIGDLAAEKGMKIVYHDHMGTGVQTAAEIDRLMEGTNPEIVSLLYDTGHLVFSGEDHIAVLNKYIDRIHHVHLKDERMDIAERVYTEKLSFLQAVKAGLVYRR